MSLDYERFEDFLYSMEDGLCPYLKELEAVSLAEKVPIIRKSTQKVLRFMLQLKKPLRVLEVGTATGFSSLLMAECLEKEAKIFTIEKMPERIQKALQNFETYDEARKISLLSGEAMDILENLVKEKESFDLIFMDAAKGQYLHFLPLVNVLLKKDGILITDNLLQEGRLLDSRYTVVRRDRTIHKRMREYVKELFKSEDFDTMLLEAGDGMSVSIKK